MIQRQLVTYGSEGAAAAAAGAACGERGEDDKAVRCRAARGATSEGSCDSGPSSNRNRAVRSGDDMQALAACISASRECEAPKEAELRSSHRAPARSPLRQMWRRQVPEPQASPRAPPAWPCPATAAYIKGWHQLGCLARDPERGVK